MKLMRALAPSCTQRVRCCNPSWAPRRREWRIAEGGPAINDLVGGQVDFSCIALVVVLPQIQAGMIKAMAIASPERADLIKDVPTTTEAGLAEFQVSAWNAIFAPRNLPREIQAKLNDAVVKALD